MKRRVLTLTVSLALIVTLLCGVIPINLFTVRASGDNSVAASDGRGEGNYASNPKTDTYDSQSGGILSKTGDYSASIPSDRKDGSFYVFETDFKWTSSTGTPQYNPNWKFSILLQDAAGNCLTTQSGQMWLLINGDTGCFTTGGGSAADWIDADGDGISDNSLATIMRDEWCNLRYEVYYINNGNDTYKREVSAYINGNVVCKTVETNNTTKPTYGKAVISVRGGTTGKFCLDNTFYGAVKRTEEELREMQWKNLASVVGGGEKGDEIVEAMKAHYAIYSPEVFDWLAKLYDRDIGAFYYSNAARDNDTVTYNGVVYELLPDVESTAQAFEFLQNSGALDYYYGGNYANATPEWMKEDIIAFVKGLQDPDGYFYHPQWKGKLTYQHRLSRDAVWCRNLLKAYGYNPYYDTGDMKGEGAPSGAVALSSRLWGSSSVIAASRVVSAAASYPAHLESKATLQAYLNNMDFAYNSYGNGNTLVTQLADITARDNALGLTGSPNSLLNTIVDHLNERIIPEKGHWDVRNEGDSGYSDYYGVNGLLKIISIYTTAGRAHPYPEAAFRSAMKSINSTEEVGAVVDIYNAYWLIQLLRSNVEQFGTAQEKATIAELQRSLIIANAPELIRNATRKIADFEKEGGSFSYARNYSSHTSQDMPVTIPYTVEGDVNATGIAISGLTGYLYAALGVADEYRVPIFTSKEADRFFRIISAGDAYAPDASLGEGSYNGADITLEYSDEGGYRSVSSAGTVSIDVPENYRNGSAYVFETDIRFAPISIPTSGYDTNWPMYIYLSDESGNITGDYSRLYVMSNGTNICLTLASGATWNDTEGNGIDDDSLAVLSTNEWYNLRYEVVQQLNGDGTTYTRKVSLYVNNTLLKTITDSSSAEYKSYAKANIATRYNVSYDLDNTYAGSSESDGRGNGEYVNDARTEKYDSQENGYASPNADNSFVISGSYAHESYIFETDFRLNGAGVAASNPNWVFYVTFNYNGTNGTTLATTESGRLCVLVNGNSACITKGGSEWVDQNGDGMSDNSLFNLELSKWYNLRYELKQTLEENGTYTRSVYIYVNGTLINSSTYDGGNIASKIPVSKLNLTCRASVQYDLDNTFFAGVSNQAEVGGVIYKSIDEAVSAATSGSIVTLLSDVELQNDLIIAEGKEIILDLAGKKILSDSFAIVLQGSLTVTDGVGGGRYCAREIQIAQEASLSVKGGSFSYELNYDVIPEAYIMAHNSVDGSYRVIANDYFEFLGGSLRYQDSQPDGFATSIRMGYRFASGFVFEGSEWGWTYRLGELDEKFLSGRSYNAETNESNIVFTNVSAKNYGKSIEVQLSFKIDLEGVSYTVTDRVRERTVIDVARKLMEITEDEEILAYLALIESAYEIAADGPATGAYAGREETLRYDGTEIGYMTTSSTKTFAANGANESCEVFVFEFDFRCKNLGIGTSYNPNWVAWAEINYTKNGSDVIATDGARRLTLLYKEGQKAYVGIGQFDYADANGDGEHDGKAACLDFEKWYNIRYELYHVPDGNGGYTRFVRLYVDGALVSEIAEASVTEISPYGSAKFNVRLSGIFDFDNVFVGYAE